MARNRTKPPHNLNKSKLSIMLKCAVEFIGSERDALNAHYVSYITQSDLKLLSRRQAEPKPEMLKCDSHA